MCFANESKVVYRNVIIDNFVLVIIKCCVEGMCVSSSSKTTTMARLIFIGGSWSCDVMEVAECCCLANIGVR